MAGILRERLLTAENGQSMADVLRPKVQGTWAFFFFFQAEDGIRYIGVTGVQTCALPIYRSIHLQARPECVSGESGTLLMRQLMDRLGYPELLARHLLDPRDVARVTHPFEELLRTALLMLVQGWGDQSDVQLLRDDPALRLAVSIRRGQRPLREAEGREPDGLCSQPTLSRLLQDLGLPENVSGLLAFLLDAAERRLRLRLGLRQGVRLRETTVDLDSLPREAFGHQPGS